MARRSEIDKRAKRTVSRQCVADHGMHKDAPERSAPIDIEQKVKAALARFNALPPDEKRRALYAQRKSLIVGETMMTYPNMTREEAERL